MRRTILDIVDRTPTPAPWSEGDKIPWDDPEFSKRMLAEHLSREHDLASRRRESIDQHVELGGLIIDCKTEDLDREAQFWSRALEGQWISL